ncbi:MAG: DUF3375 domain-containing protein [Pseudohongiellaceae bacterium]
MALDFTTLHSLSSRHPAWRLLRSDHAPLVISFLHRVFIEPNERVIPASRLAETLEDELYALREQLGPEAFPRSGQNYLADWTSPDKGWLRRFYVPDSDEPHFDLTPATERAIAWLDSLSDRSFVGTESRLLTLFQLLKQMSEGSEADPGKRIEELQKRRREIDAEIAQIESGNIPLLDATELKDRYQQFVQLARELLTDFRQVEDNFRRLDRQVRERIALWEGSKGELLEQIMGEREAITESDQGRSFGAFWDFLMSRQRQEELTQLLEKVLTLPAVLEMEPERRLRRLHYDWLEAGEHTQRTVAQLSQQLRRFLDDQAWLENKRIMEILHSIEARALAVRDTPPAGIFSAIDDTAVTVELAFERPLHTPAMKPAIVDQVLEAVDSDLDDSALYSQVFVDKSRLSSHISRMLQERNQVTLGELTKEQPLQEGLAELVAYLELGSGTFDTVFDESHLDSVSWNGAGLNRQPVRKTARLPRVIFVR